MPDSRKIAALIIDLIFHQPHIDADTQLEEIHLLESIADIIDEALDEQERYTRLEVQDEYGEEPSQ